MYFAPSGGPLDEVISDEMKSESSSTNHTKRRSIIFIAANAIRKATRTQREIEYSISVAGTGHHVFTVLLEDGPDDFMSFKSKATYRVWISTNVTSNDLLTVQILLDRDRSPNLIDEHFLWAVCNKPAQSTQSPQLQAANHKAVNREGILPLFTRIGDLCVCAWFGIVENPTVDILLGTSFIELCIHGMFPTEKSRALAWEALGEYFDKGNN